MLHSSATNKNKQTKLPKLSYEQYLYNTQQPPRDLAKMPVELQAELVDDIYYMRRQFRRTAKKMRNLYYRESARTGTALRPRYAI